MTMTRDELAARVTQGEALMRPFVWPIWGGIPVATGVVLGLVAMAVGLWRPTQILILLVLFPATVVPGTALIVFLWSRKVRAAAYCCPKCRQALLYRAGEQAVTTGACPRCGAALIDGASG
jgi:hypothetical protein